MHKITVILFYDTRKDTKFLQNLIHNPEIIKVTENLTVELRGYKDALMLWPVGHYCKAPGFQAIELFKQNNTVIYI